MDMKAPKEVIKKSAFVAVGAPVMVARKVKELSTKMMADAQTQIDEYAAEGEKVTKQLKDRNVVEELEQRINIDKVQDRVEHLRDQLETTLNNWRESFAPEGEKKAEEPKKAPVQEGTGQGSGRQEGTGQEDHSQEDHSQEDGGRRQVAPVTPARGVHDREVVEALPPFLLHLPGIEKPPAMSRGFLAPQSNLNA